MTTFKPGARIRLAEIFRDHANRDQLLDPEIVSLMGSPRIVQVWTGSAANRRSPRALQLPERDFVLRHFSRLLAPPAINPWGARRPLRWWRFNILPHAIAKHLARHPNGIAYG